MTQVRQIKESIPNIEIQEIYTITVQVIPKVRKDQIKIVHILEN